MFLKYTTTTIEDLKGDQEEDEMLQGVDCESSMGVHKIAWGLVREQAIQVFSIQVWGVLAAPLRAPFHKTEGTSLMQGTFKSIKMTSNSPLKADKMVG